jgi:hypothetical protein
MSNDADKGSDRHAGDGDSRWTAGDDERENREHIAKTGEPERDALGNADGAS